MKYLFITVIILLTYSISFADGIIIADNENYPGMILKNNSTSI